MDGLNFLDLCPCRSALVMVLWRRLCGHVLNTDAGSIDQTQLKREIKTAREKGGSGGGEGGIRTRDGVTHMRFPDARHRPD